MSICQQCHQQFEITSQDREFYKRMDIPDPKLCPLCRQQRRLAFRNERHLYKRKCDLTGKDIISIYSPDSPFKVYDQKEWWSDKWNPLDYGRVFDFSKTLNEQIKGLYRDVPHVSLYNTNVENSYYTNYALNQKNCYLIFGAGDNEDCMYGKFIVYCKDVIDSLSVYSSEFCYEGIASENCFYCRYFTNCRDCNNCTMIEDCLSCSDCFGCFGLHSKQYCIFNKQYSKEEYSEKKKEFENLNKNKIKILKEKLENLKGKLPHIQSHIYASENCTGDNIYNSVNCHYAFDCKECENCKYIYFAPKTVDTYDCTFCAPDGNRLCYNVCSTVNLESSMVNFFCWDGNNVFYSFDCHQNDDIFACVSLRHKKNCILNKAYSKFEYEKLFNKIKKHMEETGEWAEYFHFSTSPFTYNETIAQEYFPLDQAGVQALGSKWKEDSEEIAAKKFKIIPQEEDFYHRMKLPKPEIGPDQRHMDRLKAHNFFQLFDRKCPKCRKNMQTIYSPENSNIIYCAECYKKEIY